MLVLIFNICFITQLLVWLIVCASAFAQIEIQHSHKIPFDKRLYKWIIPMYWVYELIINLPLIISVVKEQWNDIKNEDKKRD